MSFRPRLRHALALGACAAIGLGPARTTAVAEEAKRGFTAGQAASGRAAYRANCAACHGQHLEGISGPALAGEGANLKAEAARDTFAYMSKNMPAGSPGGLPVATYIDLMAYLLQANGNRPSSTRLTSAALKASDAKIGGAR